MAFEIHFLGKPVEKVESRDEAVWHLGSSIGNALMIEGKKKTVQSCGLNLMLK